MSEQKNTEFLTVKDLVVEYVLSEETVHAVNGVSFQLGRGETLGLVGETGAGKTTIAKSIMQILQTPPAKIRQGEIRLDGTDLLKLTNKEMYDVRGRKVSMIFQDPMTSLNPVHKVGDQIAEVVRIHHPEMSRQQVRQRAEEMLERVGIPKTRYTEYPHQFSGGMKQRVVIAMALACNPELLIADEPTSALDVTIQAEVLTMIQQLKTDFNTAMIMITHDLGIVAQVCDYVAIIYAGEIVEYGTKEEIYLHRMHPYTVGLFGAIPQLDFKVDRLAAIDGLPPSPTELPEGCHFHPRCPYATSACREGSIPNEEVRPGHFCKCLHPEERGMLS